MLWCLLNAQPKQIFGYAFYQIEWQQKAQEKTANAYMEAYVLTVYTFIKNT